MLKSGLAEKMRQKHRWLSDSDARIAIDVLFYALTQALCQGRRVEIRGFGGFHVTRLGPRLARNPKSGTPIQVPAKSVVRFRPTGALAKLPPAGGAEVTGG